jgi:hypothetical protein
MFGNSPEYGLKGQHILSSCCPWSELYGYEEDQGNKKEQEEMIDDNESEDAPVLNLNTQRASPQQITKAKESGSVILIDHLRSRQSPGTKGKVLQNLKQASIANSQQRRGKTSGSVAFSTKANSCRLECDKTIPETSPYSIGFTITVSAAKWNRLLGNTLNTIQALGHHPIKTSAKKETVLTQALKSTRLPDSQTEKLCTVAYNLGSHGYNYAVIKPRHLDFPCLQIYANQYSHLMLVQLRMVYPSGSIKHHIIGIVPVEIGNKIHMHIF